MSVIFAQVLVPPPVGTIEWVPPHPESQPPIIPPAPAAAPSLISSRRVIGTDPIGDSYPQRSWMRIPSPEVVASASAVLSTPSCIIKTNGASLEPRKLVAAAG